MKTIYIVSLEEQDEPSTLLRAYHDLDTAIEYVEMNWPNGQETGYLEWFLGGFQYILIRQIPLED